MFFVKKTIFLVKEMILSFIIKVFIRLKLFYIMSEESGEKIIPVSIEDEMKTAYIDYSMSVIVSRALTGCK